MKRRPVHVEVSDHAVLRWLEREHGLDVILLKAHIAGIVGEGAALGAAAVCLGKVRFVLRDTAAIVAHADKVVVATALDRDGIFLPQRKEGPTS
jgi:hypothetical protein